MGDYTIAVVGNPNSGKTTLFNGLTGSNQRIGNWPGVTVEKKEGSLQYGVDRYLIVDLPGIYSLFAFSEDERVARNYIINERPDLVVNIVDSTNLERNLYLTTQLLELDVPVLIVLNMIDLARKEHLAIEIEHLSRHLEVPCIGISAVKGRTETDKVMRAVSEAVQTKPVSSVEVAYPNEVEEIIDRWNDRLTDHADCVGATPRWLAVKVLEEEDSITGRIVDEGFLSGEEIDDALEHIRSILGEPADVIMADYRYGFIHGLVRDVIKRTANRRTVTDRVDRVVMHRFLGVPIFMAAMLAVFLVTIGIGERLIGPFERLFGFIFVDGAASLLGRINAPVWIVALISGGLGTGIQTVATFIPVIFLMFFMLSLLEDSGYMARAAFVMDKFMGFLGLPGKSFVPMIVGFGCTVPAIMAARTLESKRDRILTVFMTPFMSCGARLSVYTVVTAVFFSHSAGLVVFSLYMVGIAAAILSGLLLKKTILLGETSHLIMELPPYHTPRLKHIMIHTWNNLKGFIFRAGKFIIIAAFILSFFNSFGTDGKFGHEGSDTSILATIGRAITPVFEPFGVEKENWPASVALFTGIFAKEAVVGTMNALYGQMESGVTGEAGSGVMRRYFPRGQAQVYAFLLFVLLYFPCIASLGVAIKEIGRGYGTLMVVYQTLLAWIIATLFYQIVLGHSLLWIGTALGIGLLMTGTLIIAGRIGRKKEHYL